MRDNGERFTRAGDPADPRGKGGLATSISEVVT